MAPAGSEPSIAAVLHLRISHEHTQSPQTYLSKYTADRLPPARLQIAMPKQTDGHAHTHTHTLDSHTCIHTYS